VDYDPLIGSADGDVDDPPLTFSAAVLSMRLPASTLAFIFIYFYFSCWYFLLFSFPSLYDKPFFSSSFSSPLLSCLCTDGYSGRWP